MAIRVHLVRHTRVDVPKGICYGQSDVPLAPSFAQEATRLEAELRTLCPSPWLVLTSPLRRCTCLANFCGYPTAERDDRLMELNFGAWELMPFGEINDPRLALWYEDWVEIAPTGGESYLMQCQRVECLLDEVRRRLPDEAEALIFAHAGVLRAALVYTGRYAPRESFAYQPDYGEVLTLELEPLPK